MEPRAGVEPTIRDLQSLALPLGYRGNERTFVGRGISPLPTFKAASVLMLPLHQLA